MTQGIIITAHGRQYQVRLADGTVRLCFTRGKKSEVACGDQVTIEHSDKDQGVITAVGERRSLLYRSNDFRQKLIAANVTQIVIVVATEPSFSDELVTRALVAAESQKIQALIVLNKCDLAERIPAATAILAPFEKLGYPILRLSAQADAEFLRPFLDRQSSVLVGQSGMGKSTLINALIPGIESPTREISETLNSGKHTTTHATLYPLDAQSTLIDSPGMQEFGLHHLAPEDIEYGFPEFRPFSGTCRFRNCRHDREPDCAIRDALNRGDIHPRRYAVFRTLMAETA